MNGQMVFDLCWTAVTGIVAGGAFGLALSMRRTLREQGKFLTAITREAAAMVRWIGERDPRFAAEAIARYKRAMEEGAVDRIEFLDSLEPSHRQPPQ